MSNFIVNDKILNRILTFLSNWDFYGNGNLRLKFWDKLGYNELKSLTEEPTQEQLLSAVGFVLKEINTEAVNQRYKEKTKGELFIFKYEDCNIYQAYNHLRCLTYQMNEGNIPETETYKLLQEIENLMCLEIANEYEEVKNAEWEAK